jgi:uncharacterized repeat protein (TIGR03803 family)
VIFDAAGNLYGTTSTGGAYGSGTVFELTPTAGGTWSEKVLYSFKNDGTDGINPKAGVIFDAAGNLYGTTSHGSPSHQGTVFELTPAVGGTWTEKVLHSFINDGMDGGIPEAGPLIFDAAGNLYGTTFTGGAYGSGTVFELTPAAGGTWTEKVLYSFNPFNGADGAAPYDGLIFDAAGNLYGTTEVGGTGGCGGYSCGTVFELTPAAGGTWTEKVLYRFQGGADGAYPYDAGVIFDAAGNLYGTTYAGGTSGAGTVFELTRAAGGTWTEKVLYRFQGGADGAVPVGGLIFDATGNLYGTACQGGAGGCGGYGCGSVFELTPAAGGTWTENVLHSFSDTPDGAGPEGGLVLDSAGNLYGTTDGGGPSGFGTVFEFIEGTSAQVQFLPSSLTFGDEPVGKSSPPLSSTLYNNTSSTVVFNSITPNGDFSETNNCGSSLPAGGHCTFAVVFTPTATGTRIGSITVVDNALGHVQTLNLVGTSGGGGGGTGVTASPTKLTFPDQEINTISAPQTVTFTNNGSSSVTITSIRITGNFYAPPGGSNCGVTLGAHQSCYVSLTFNPAAPPGLKSGTLTFNDSAGSLIVQLFGNATDTGLPGLTATVTGVFRYGNSVTVSLQVKNNGTGNADNIQLTSISAVAGGGLVTYTGPLPVILYGLAPGASTSPQLTFNVSGPVQMFQIAERATWQDDFGHGYGGAYAQSVTLSP